MINPCTPSTPPPASSSSRGLMARQGRRFLSVHARPRIDIRRGAGHTPGEIQAAISCAGIFIRRILVREGEGGVADDERGAARRGLAISEASPLLMPARASSSCASQCCSAGCFTAKSRIPSCSTSSSRARDSWKGAATSKANR